MLPLSSITGRLSLRYSVTELNRFGPLSEAVCELSYHSKALSASCWTYLQGRSPVPLQLQKTRLENGGETVQCVLIVHSCRLPTSANR